MRQAFDKLSREFGADVAQEYQDNARAIINGDEIGRHQIKKIQQRKKLFGLFYKSCSSHYGFFIESKE